MRVIEGLLDLSHISGDIDTICSFDGNWYVNTEETIGKHKGRFHMITSGSCRVYFKGEDSFILKKGELLYIPYGKEHALSAINFDNTEERDEVIHSNNTAYTEWTSGSTHPRFTMICGSFTYHDDFILLQIFKDHQIITFDDKLFKCLTNLITIDVELRESTFSENEYSNKSIAVLIFNYIVRYYTKSLHEDDNINYTKNQDLITRNSLLAGFKDKRLSVVLNEIINKPELQWDLDTMSKMVNMSRSNFLRIFTQVLGTSPIALVNNLRIQKAKILLTTTSHRMSLIGQMCGFYNESNFSKAFKAVVGMSPSKYKKHSPDHGISNVFDEDEF